MRPEVAFACPTREKMGVASFELQLPVCSLSFSCNHSGIFLVSLALDPCSFGGKLLGFASVVDPPDSGFPTCRIVGISSMC